MSIPLCLFKSVSVVRIPHEYDGWRKQIKVIKKMFFIKILFFSFFKSCISMQCTYLYICRYKRVHKDEDKTLRLQKNVMQWCNANILTLCHKVTYFILWNSYECFKYKLEKESISEYIFFFLLTHMLHNFWIIPSISFNVLCLW